MKLSQFYGKKILSTAGREGYIISVGANADRSLSFLCADLNEREFTVDMESVLRLGDYVIYEDSENAKRATVPLRLGRACFDTSGKYLGNLEDFTVSRGKLKTAKIGKKNYPAEGLITGDVIIVRELRRLKSDVIKGGKTLFKKGTFVTDEVLDEAAAEGEYVQTTLKTI